MAGLSIEEIVQMLDEDSDDDFEGMMKLMFVKETKN